MNKIGFGTYKLNNDIAYNTIIKALELGYRHFDTAELYKNEKEIGLATQDYINNNENININDIFITTKIWRKTLKKGYMEIKSSVLRSIEYLGKIDLLLLHTPDNIIDSWDSLSQLKEEFPNKILNIGVSNFNIENLQIISDNFNEYPSYNQIEVHPYCTRNKLIEFCNLHNINVIAHSSLLRLKYKQFNSGLLTDLSLKYNISIPSLLLAWALNKGFHVIPQSCNELHMIENLNVVNISINYEDMDKLDKLNKNFYLYTKYHD